MKISDVINRDIVCSCGRTHRCDIPALEIGEEALNKLPELVQPYAHILLVSDQNTDPLCGDRVRAMLGDRLENNCVLHSEGFLVPDEDSIAKIEASASDNIDLVLGIGSGVINDLCKYVAFDHKADSGIIATAPSMDGFASSGAAMILKGMKVTLTTRAPSLILGDVDILKNAPMEMIRAGYADIIGKYSSLNDWKLSRLVNDEYFCQYIYDIVLENTDQIRSMAAAISRREPAAIGALMETLVLSGVCLTLPQTTRPGSGSEHHLSHFFEITGLIEDKPYFLHGIDVGYSVVVTARLREEIRALENPEFHTLSREDREACYRKIYQNYWQEIKAIQDKVGYYDKDLTPVYREKWQEICQVLAECPTAEEMREMLAQVGFEFAAFEEMYGPEKIQNGIWFGKDLKDRYTVLGLYDSLFFDEQQLRKIL